MITFRRLYSQTSLHPFSFSYKLSYLAGVTSALPARNNSYKSPMAACTHFTRFRPSSRQCFNKTRRGPIIQLTAARRNFLEQHFAFRDVKIIIYTRVYGEKRNKTDVQEGEVPLKRPETSRHN